MPFELGLAIGILGVDRNWFVFERVPYQLSRSLSDIAGYDGPIHHGTAEGILRAVADTMGTKGGQIGHADLLDVARDLQKVARNIKNEHDSLFKRAAFADLVLRRKPWKIASHLRNEARQAGFLEPRCAALRSERGRKRFRDRVGVRPTFAGAPYAERTIDRVGPHVGWMRAQWIAAHVLHLDERPIPALAVVKRLVRDDRRQVEQRHREGVLPEREHPHCSVPPVHAQAPAWHLAGLNSHR